MKFTLAITLRCNLACPYCYIQKADATMSLSTARNIVDYAFENSKSSEKIEIGFFGGEPLLQFDLMRRITSLIVNHPSYDQERVIVSVTTNGTIFNQEIADFLTEKRVIPCVSCDGPPEVQDCARVFPDGRPSSGVVEENLKQILRRFPLTPVNSVFSPANLHHVPRTVDYLSHLGVSNIYLNPDIFGRWTEREAQMLPGIYEALGRMYMDFYRGGTPRYISLIDGKIAAILRGGYKPVERCRMGSGEFAFGPSGNVYLCERFIGPDEGGPHCIGNIDQGFSGARGCQKISSSPANGPCQECGIRDYCMNWCGCTNYFTAGSYNTVSPFICASERAAVETAFSLIQRMGAEGMDFLHHLAGTPLANTILAAMEEAGALR
ncbi:MAG: radical SAM protein [Methanosarcinales archaeon]|nr:radical SAM protein [Methanosarcinales archaeon]